MTGNQLAGEIHDSLAQLFTGISMQLNGEIYPDLGSNFLRPPN